MIGPHYTSDGTLHHKFLLPTLMDAIFKLHKCGFETCVEVCDGASSNLTMIKELTGAERKAYRYVFTSCISDSSWAFNIRVLFFLLFFSLLGVVVASLGSFNVAEFVSLDLVFLLFLAGSASGPSKKSRVTFLYSVYIFLSL